MARVLQTGQPQITDLLVAGPFHQALRSAISARGLTLDRLRARLARRGMPIALSTLSDWQQGHRHPGSERSLSIVAALEEILDLPPRSLRRLIAHAAHGIDEGHGPIGELLDRFPRSRDRDTVILSQQQKVLLDQRGVSHHVWSRTLIRARRGGVDRYLLRYFGDRGCAIDEVELCALENCRLGRVERHHAQPVLVAELLLDTTLREGDTWVLEHALTDRTAEPGTDHGHAFRYTVEHYLLEVRFDPRRLPRACYSYTRANLHEPMHRTGWLEPTSHHAVHLSASNVRTGVLGIAWEWLK